MPYGQPRFNIRIRRRSFIGFSVMDALMWTFGSIIVILAFGLTFWQGVGVVVLSYSLRPVT